MPVNLFDASFYRAANPDLAVAGLTTDAQVLSHFQVTGLDEGRVFSPFVNLDLYRASNSDLATAGLTTNRQLYDHLQNTGVREGRRFSEFVDINFYVAANSDVNTAFSGDRSLAFEHLHTTGVSEGRRFSQFVDTNFYLAANSDVAQAYGNNRVLALQHLELAGLSEGRQVSQFFDINYYRTNNFDLANAELRGRQLLQHFLQSGLQEGRAFSLPFDVNYYRTVNSDLAAAGLNNQQLYENFQLVGLNEGRISSASFNIGVYQANNPDLVAGLNNQQTYDRFVLSGLREGRPGSDYAGNTLGTARDIPLGSTESSFTDFVGSSDTTDYYRFTLTAASNFRLTLSPIRIGNAVVIDGEAADVQLIQDANGNGVVDEGEAIATLPPSTATTKTINRNNLAAGTYFVRVYPDGVGVNTNYNLSLSANPVIEVPLYNGSLGGTPDTQGWLAFGTTPSPINGTQSASGGRTNLVSGGFGLAGYSNYTPSSTPNLANLAFPILNRTTGFTIRFNVQLNSESHSGDNNGDGLDDRAGFSVIALSSDLQGIELGFWTNEIWAQETGTAPPPNGTLFTHDDVERAFRNTRLLTSYELSVLGNTYQLFADGSSILTGTLRNYSAFNPPFGLPYDPYERPNFLFFGDSSTSASSNSNLQSISVAIAD